jgi:toxin ParE1/3/4
MRRYEVILTEDALLDLDNIGRYIALHDTPAKAEQVAQGIEKTFSSLATLPNRGNHPRELLAMGNRAYREAHYKPYRIVYRVLDREVLVLIIADGRRDMRALLARRLLGA